MISLRSLTKPRNEIDEFVEDRFSWRDRNEIVMRRRRAWWRTYYDFMMRWPAVTRPIIVLFWATLLYVAFVLGFLIASAFI